MKHELLGKLIRDGNSGAVGRVIGRTEWLNIETPSLVIQPPARSDGSVPSTFYVPETAAIVLPGQPNSPDIVQ